MGDVVVLYEDNHLIAVEKQPGILSQADGKDPADVLSDVKEYLKVKYDKPGRVYLGLLHRLDKPVGGVMLFAKTSKAAKRLNEQMRNGLFEKQYLAVVKGELRDRSGRLDGYIIKDTEMNMSRIVTAGSKDSKYASLKYELLSYKEGFSLVKVMLLTGRSHQIRVQFSNMGNPVAGDRKYGDDRSHYTVALWSYKLCVDHPVKNERICFVSRPEQKGIWNKYGSGDI